MENYNYNSNTILKFLRKVLNEINKDYIDSGMRTAFLMKRYIEKYHLDNELGPKHVLLCMLKDIGLFYMDGEVPSDDPALAAASSYTFLAHCSPLDEAARPLLFYKAKYVESQSNMDYDLGLLMTLLNQVSLFIYQRKDPEDIEELLRKGKKNGYYKPEQVKRVIKLLRDEPDVIEKLNSESNLFVYETSKYISLAGYTDEELKGFIDTTSYAFEFHNHETLAHTVTTAKIAYELALKCKMTKETADIIELAGRVHDIGKIRVPREILCYPGKLEGEDLEEMQRHVVYTREIIEGCFSYKIVDIASNHHEKLDGTGYPRGLKAIDLSSADKIIAVADICSALYCRRSYKAAFTDEKIQEILMSDAKAGKLDMRIVEHLCASYDSIMQVAKEAEAVVLEKYKNMKAEYEALTKSNALRKFFEEDEIEKEEDEPFNEDAVKTEEFIEGVAANLSQEEVEQVIYVDENGNEIDYDPTLDDYEVETKEYIEEAPIDEKIPAEEEPEEEVIPMDADDLKVSDVSLEDVPEEEFAMEEEEGEEEDEFEAYINSLAKEETEKEAPTEEPKEEPLSEEDEFEAYINSLAEENAVFDEIAEENKEEFESKEESKEEPQAPEVEATTLEALSEDTPVEDEVKTEEPKKEPKKTKGMFTRPMKNFDPFAEDPFAEPVEEAKPEPKEETVTEEEPTEVGEAPVEEEEESSKPEVEETPVEEESTEEELEPEEETLVEEETSEAPLEEAKDEEPLETAEEEALVEDNSLDEDNIEEETLVEETSEAPSIEEEKAPVEEDAYVTSYFDEEELEEEEEASKPEVEETPVEDEPLEEGTSFAPEPEDIPKETLVEEPKVEEEAYVTSYFDEEELEEDSKEEAPKKEPKPKKSSEDFDDEEEEEDEDDEEEEDDLDEDDEDDSSEEEDLNPKHKRFFSNDSYKKMKFSYNPKKKKR